MLVKLPGGELRHELECSLAFRGKIGEAILPVKDHGYLGYDPFPYPKAGHSFRFQMVEITSEHPAAVQFGFLPHETPWKEEASWVVETYLQRDLDGVAGFPFNRTHIDVCPMQWFQVRTSPVEAGKEGEIMVIFHGLMRKPVR